MKKVLYLLLICVLFASCSSDDDEKDDTKYLDNKLIEGSWYWMQHGDSTVFTFKENASRKVYDKYSQKEINSQFRGKYKLTSDRIIYTDYLSEKYNSYKLKNDSLWIVESSDGTYTKYLRVK